MTHKVRLGSQYTRTKAQQLIWQAPDGYVMTLAGPKRTSEQNDKMWAMLTDISVAMPEGRRMIPDEWKAVFMQACGWEQQFLEGLDGRPFPTGFRSSRMTVKQMADLITFIGAYGDQHGVKWSESTVRE